MAGTDRTREAVPGGPAIVLVEPLLGENIGAAARAMLNFGLTDMRLVRPRDPWPNEKARAMASRADAVIDGARVYRRTADAVAELHHVYATTARSRDMLKPALTPRAAMEAARRRAAMGESCGILFGREKSGLHNEDVAVSEAIIAVPANPAFASLNLAQAVLILGYEWFLAGDDAPDRGFPRGAARRANHGELMGLFDHLERELDAGGFLYPPEKRPAMVRNIRNIFSRAGLMEQEVRTLRGIVRALARPRNRRTREP